MGTLSRQLASLCWERQGRVDCNGMKGFAGNKQERPQQSSFPPQLPDGMPRKPREGCTAGPSAEMLPEMPSSGWKQEAIGSSAQSNECN